MMRAFKLQISLLVLIFLTSCLGYAPPLGQQQNYSSSNPYAPQYGYGVQPPPPAQSQPPAPPRNDNEYDDKKDQDPNRDSILSQNKTGDQCENEKRQHECHLLCKEMYKRNDDKEDCEELSSKTVSYIYNVHKILENPNSSNLLSIFPEDLEVYLNISIAAFDRLIGEYSKNDAKDVLSWIAQNEEITMLFQDEDNDYRSFNYLLEVAFNSFDKDELDEPFSKDIDSDDTLFELAIGNETALELFQDYIFETATQCTDEDDEEVTEECFEVFCKIGDSFGDDASDKYNREDWVSNSSNFESYLDDIIDEGINGKITSEDGVDYFSWGSDNNYYEDIDDLDDWVEDLCDGLI